MARKFERGEWFASSVIFDRNEAILSLVAKIRRTAF